MKLLNANAVERQGAVGKGMDEEEGELIQSLKIL